MPELLWELHHTMLQSSHKYQVQYLRPLTHGTEIEKVVMQTGLNGAYYTVSRYQLPTRTGLSGSKFKYQICFQDCSPP